MVKGKKKVNVAKANNGKVDIEVDVKNVKGRRRRGNRVGGNGAGAPISTSISLLPKNSPKLRIHGTDRIVHIPEAQYADGAVMVDLSISPEITPRLSHIAQAYQRVRYKKLVFHIVSMCPTTTAGGIATAFVADPTDVLGGGTDALNRVVAQAGAKITKIWQSAIVRASITGDLLYTSEPPLGDQRLYSPGRLWMVSESKFSSVVPITVYMEWEVELSVPSLESKTKEAGAIVVGVDFYTRSTNPGFWFKDGPGGDDPRSKIPGIQFDVVYQSKSKSYIQWSSSAGNYDKFILVNDPVHGVTFTAVGFDRKPIVEVAKLNQWVLEKGQPLFPTPENVQVGLEFVCTQNQLSRLSSPKPAQPLKLQTFSSTTTVETPTGSSKLLRTSERPLSLKELTPAQLQDLQMEFQSRLRAPSRSPSFEVLCDE